MQGNDYITLRVDVTGATPGEEALELAAWVFLPPELTPEVTLLVCSHGGSLTKHYWHLSGFPTYSFACDMASRGYVVVAFDQLGTGESTVPANLDELTSAALARGSHLLTERLTLALQTGALSAAVPPVTVARRVGIGHSFGGLMIIRQQARFKTNDALAILGSTLLELQFSAAHAERRAQLAELIDRLWSGASPEEVEQRLFHELGGDPPTNHSRSDEVLEIFHLPDVPREVIEADTAFLQRRIGPVACVPVIAGAVREDARAIDVPVFLGFGERDVSPNPHDEPAQYPSSDDITLHVLPGSAHCHNYASTRARQWDRIATWIQGLPV